MYIARLTTPHCTFWLNRAGQWQHDPARAAPYPTRTRAYDAAVASGEISLRWQERVTVVRTETPR